METQASAIALAVDRYLRTGKYSSVDPSVLAKALDDRLRLEAQSSLKKAKSLASRLVKVSTGGSPLLALTAYRALARITHMSVKHAEAEQAYLKARRLAGEDRLVIARIDRALVDVYMYLGKFAESRRCARMAIRAFRSLGAAADIAMTQVNLGNLLHRQDKHRDAERIYGLAEDYFLSVGDELSVARCRYNRANTLVQLFAFEEAEPLYIASRDTYLKHKFHLDATDAQYGLAWLAMLRGEFHVALTELSTCEAAYRKTGQPKGAALCELDRAEVYLGLNLLTDALEASRNAEKQFRSLGHRYEQSKAALFRAKAAFGLGLFVEARKEMRVAVAGFESEGNSGFLGATYLLSSQIADKAKTRSALLAKSRKQFSKAQLPLWRAICDLYEAAQSRHRSRVLADLSNNRAVHEVPHLFAGWQTLLGDIAESSGKSRQAKRHWQAAADRLDAVRAQLPPLELRTKFGVGMSSPHRKLIAAEIGLSPERAAAWVERYKTAGLWATLSSLEHSPEQRRRAEDSLVSLAAQVAAMSRQIGRVAGERGAPAREAQKSVSLLQKKVRLAMASAEAKAMGEVDSIERIVEDIRKVSCQLPVIHFHLAQDDIVALIHVLGQTRLVRIGDGRKLLQEAMRQWRFLLESELLSQQLPSSNRIRAEEQFFGQLAQKIWLPLEIDRQAKRVLILPEGDLANLPWQALMVDNRPLLERHFIVQAPSLRHHLHASKIAVKSQRVELFEGAADDLPMVTEELQSLSERSASTCLVHRGAIRGDWPVEGEAHIWHYSGHSELRPDNPFYSSLNLVDGPLFAADFRLREVKVGLVTLAACRSGQQVALPGEESTGLVRSLLEMGARNVMAGNWPVADKSTAYWMHNFYEQYLSHGSLAQATQTAAQRVRQKFPSAYHWAAFAVHGAGE